MNRLNEMIVLKNQTILEEDTERIKMFDEDFLILETNFGVVYPRNLKIIAKEIGFGKSLLVDFPNCLNQQIHYKTYLTIDFIKTLLDFEIGIEEIENLEFNLLEKTFNNTVVEQIYEMAYPEFKCVETAVNIFDDYYNCYIVLVLTGKNKGNICYDEWTNIKYKSFDHNFSSFNLITSFENYVIQKMTKS